MKFFDWLSDWMTVIKRPAAGVPAKTPAEVRTDLLALNRRTAPFIVRDGTPENVDFVAEWRIVDAKWYEIFAKAGLKKGFKVLMKLDEQAKEVRSIDEMQSVEWRAEGLSLSWEKEISRGQIKQYSYGRAFAFTEHGPYGEVYHYKFVSGELKTPLQDAVTKAGWVWRGIPFGRL
jgi:hypothetical protein